MALLDLAKSPYGGELRLLPENATQLPITPRALIFHSVVGSAAGAYEYFRTKSNLESHFIVTGGGEIWQLIDTERRADANYHANSFAVSVETEDGGDPDTQPWTPHQIDALAWIAWEVHRTHGIPLAKATRWDGSGIGYHSQFPPWSPVTKSCPGRVRIRQFNDLLLPRIARGPVEDDDMTPDQFNAAMYRVLLFQKTGRANAYVNQTTMPALFEGLGPEPVWARPEGEAVAAIDEALTENARALAEIRRDVARIAERLGFSPDPDAAPTEILPPGPRS